MKPPDHESYPPDGSGLLQDTSTRARDFIITTETQTKRPRHSPPTRIEEPGECSRSKTPPPSQSPEPSNQSSLNPNGNPGHRPKRHVQLIGTHDDKDGDNARNMELQSPDLVGRETGDQNQQPSGGIVDRVRTKLRRHSILPDNSAKGKRWSFKRAAKALSKAFRQSKGRRSKQAKGKMLETNISNEGVDSPNTGENPESVIAQPAAVQPGGVYPVSRRPSGSGTGYQLPYRTAPEIHPAFRSQMQQANDLQGGLYMTAPSQLATVQELHAMPSSTFKTSPGQDKRGYYQSSSMRGYPNPKGAVIIQSPHPIADAYTYEEDWSHVHEARAKAQAQIQSQSTAAMGGQTPQIPERFSSKWKPRSFRSGSYRRARSVCGSLDSRVSWNPFDLPGPPKQTLMSDMMEVLAGTSSRLAAQSRDTLHHKASNNNACTTTPATGYTAPITPTLKGTKSKNNILGGTPPSNKKLTLSPTQASASSERQGNMSSAHTNRTNMTQEDSAIGGLTPSKSGHPFQKKQHQQQQQQDFSPLAQKQNGTANGAEKAPVTMSLTSVPHFLRHQRTSSSIYQADDNEDELIPPISNITTATTATTATTTGGVKERLSQGSYRSSRIAGTTGKATLPTTYQSQGELCKYAGVDDDDDEDGDYPSFLNKAAKTTGMVGSSQNSRKKPSGESMSIRGEDRAWWTQTGAGSGTGNSIGTGARNSSGVERSSVSVRDSVQGDGLGLLNERAVGERCMEVGGERDKGKMRMYWEEAEEEAEWEEEMYRVERNSSSSSPSPKKRVGMATGTGSRNGNHSR